MPGKSYNNPQLEYERNKKEVAAATQRQNTEREKAIQDAERKKKAATLKDQISSNNTSITKLQDLIVSAEKTKSGYITSYNAAVRNSKSPSSPGGATQTPGELAAIASWQTLITGREQLISSSKKNIQDLKNKNDSLTKQFNQLYNIKAVGNYSVTLGRVNTSTNASNTSSSSSSANTGNRKGELEQVKPVGPYKYNLPLIKPARFSTNPNSPLVSSMGDNSNLIGVPGFNSTNAENFWKEKPGRGVLRVNREWMKSILNSTTTDKGNSGNLDIQGSTQRTPDRRLYGFRFLYNPEKISMVYDINADLHPGLISTGKDVFLPLTKSSSAVTMSLVLNRMEDMKYRENPELAIRNQVYYGAGETSSLLDDVKELHEKGTMYDLEYMFRVMNAPHAIFNSKLNGKTADMGFIRPSILELHLGNRLRYPVRVISLAVEHKIFDPRMVPIFSVVQITFGRFIEYETDASGKNSSTSITVAPNQGGFR